MKNQKEVTVGQDMFVAFAYKLTDDKSGELLFETPKDAPDTIVYGVTPGVTPGLLLALKDLKAGDKFGVTLPPEAAFGNRNDQMVMKLEKEIFTVDGQLAEEVKVDAMLNMLTENQERVLGRVLDISDTHVTMDFNHPFADRTVRYEGEVVDVRPITAEELKQMQHGCGGCCHGGDCGDGCGDHKEGGCCCGC